MIYVKKYDPCKHAQHAQHIQNTYNDKYNKYNKSSKLLSDSYVIIKKIGSGSFGEVYLAQYKDSRYVAAKVEERSKPKRILNEYKIYKYLHNNGFSQGLPQIYDFIETSDYNIMFMQLLGPSLEDMFNKYNRKFMLTTVLELADQLITLLENLHNLKFLHRDIKPNNFLVGINPSDKENTGHPSCKQVYIMDFGLSKKYMNNSVHIPFRDKKSLIGTARYASVNMHMGIEPTRRDDLESLGYMLIYFIKGSLPWQGLKRKRGISNIDLIGEVKMCTGVDVLCQGIHGCFIEYIKYCRGLKFDETPDYIYMKNIFKTCALELNITPKYEWIN